MYHGSGLNFVEVFCIILGFSYLHVMVWSS